MIAKLSVKTALREGKTYLKESYFSPPFKIADITEDKQAGPLHLMLMSSSPGVLDGDELQIQLELSEKTTLFLHTQSYQRVFTMNNGACQTMKVFMESGASLTYLPSPVVPHENAIFVAGNQIYLRKNCHLVWGEILTCGRKLNGEIFRFSKYRNVTEIFLNGQLIIRENLLLQPRLIDPSGMGQMEGFTHQASLIMLDEKLNKALLTEQIVAFLSSFHDLIFGVTEAHENGIMLRILGNKAEQLHDCLKKIAGWHSLPELNLKQNADAS